jgi:hypothetical protein
MRLKGVEPERIWRTQDRGACAADFPIHPGGDTTIVVTPDIALLLRSLRHRKQKPAADV